MQQCPVRKWCGECIRLATALEPIWCSVGLDQCRVIHARISKLGYNTSGYELGNEPGCWGMHGGTVSPKQHALDFAVLRSVIKKVYSRQQKAPSVIGPDTTNCGGDVFNATIAESPDIDVATVHLYSVVPTANIEGFLHAAQSNAMCTSARAALTRSNTQGRKEPHAMV